ncbi:MAG: ABC transporter permease [Clostridia bacterium]|nr:ABC transporter permease [Clostridia bacterium]
MEKDKLNVMPEAEVVENTTNALKAEEIKEEVKPAAPESVSGQAKAEKAEEAKAEKPEEIKAEKAEKAEVANAEKAEETNKEQKPTAPESSNNENKGATGAEMVEEQQTYKEMSPIQLVFRRFFRSKLSIVGLIMIIFLFAFSFLGPVIYTAATDWGEATVDRGEFIEQHYDQYTIIGDNGEEIIVTEVVETTDYINKYATPSATHLLGTDEKGMDVFIRLMYGGRISLTIGFIVVILETLLGVLLGGIAGYFGRWVDQLIMRIVDIFNCIPTLPILLIASAVIDSWQVEADQRIYILMVIITIFGWSGTARLVRGQILSLREQEYITATEVMGLPTWRKIFKHLIPNVMPQLIVSMTLGLGSVILYESTLSYLGLGVQLPKAAWGTMIAGANNPEVLNYHLNMWLPAGILIVIAVLGFNFVGDGLRDAMDPKAKK